MRAWQVVRTGAPSEALELREVPVPDPAQGEIVVRSTRTVLNYNEVDGCRGRYLTVNPPMPYTLGMEAVGEVVAAGAGLEGWLGKRVMATATGAFGAHADCVACPIDMAFEAPATLDDTQAAAFFFPFHLAYLGIHERGRLQPGETVLIHAAAGGVGSAAVQLAKAAGARVIATCGSSEKEAFCQSIGADVVVNYRSADFTKVVDEVTDGVGADLVFDGVGGEVTQQSLKALARNGRLMIIGFASGIEAEEVAAITPRQFCFGQFSVGGVLLSYRSDATAVRRTTGINVTPRTVGERLHDHLLKMLARGQIRPIVGDEVDFAELPRALDRMERRETIGRIVVRVR